MNVGSRHSEDRLSCLPTMMALYVLGVRVPLPGVMGVSLCYKPPLKAACWELKKGLH